MTERSSTGSGLADKTWEAILERVGPSDALQVGLTAYTRGNRRIATRAWSRVIDSVDPDAAPQAACYLGALLAEDGDLAGARAAYEQAAASAHPDAAATAAVKLGALLAEQGDLAGARAAYEQAAASAHPDAAATAAVKLGALLAEQGDLAGARAAYEQAAASAHPDAAAIAQTYLRILPDAEGGDRPSLKGGTITCPACGGRALGMARYCPSCGEQLRTGPVAQSATRKTITALFVDVVDSTSLAVRLEAEPFQDVLRRFYGVTRRVIEEHGGTPQKLIGDALLALFGVPVVYEDDALRAVRAAVALRSALTALNDELERNWSIRLAFRIGLNTGEAIIDDPAETEIIGDAVNIAARLEQAADVGEILIADSTHQLVREYVIVERLGSHRIKGRRSPVIVWRLKGLRPSTARTSRPQALMIGRDLEMNLLRLAYQRGTRDGICHLVTVFGDAGIGKTRLIEEFVNQLEHSALILRGGCMAYGEGTHYAPIGQMLRQVAQIRGDDTPALATHKLAMLNSSPSDTSHLAWLLDLPGGRGNPEGVLQALHGVFERIATQRPLVLAIDDLHLAQPVLVELVESLGEALTNVPILIICVARQELRDIHRTWGMRTPNAVTLRLGPLAEEEAQQLVSQLLRDGKPTNELLTRVYAAAAGNPLFLVELTAMLREQDRLRLENGNWVLAGDPFFQSAPPTIEALLAARLDRLGEMEGMILARAALIGVHFTEAEVTALVPESPASIATTLGHLVRADLLVQEPQEDPAGQGYAFRHVLIREAAYWRMPKQVRAEFHERYANWLERLAPDATADRGETIGYHLEQAYRGRSEFGLRDQTTFQLGVRAGELLAAAGHREALRGALPAVARGLLEHAVELLPANHPQRLDSTLDLAEVLQEDDPQKALAIYNRVVEAAEQSGHRATAMYAALGCLETRWLRGMDDPTVTDLEEGGRTIKAARELFRRLRDDIGQARARRLMAYRQALGGNSAQAAQAAGQAIDLAHRAAAPRLEAETRGLHLNIRFRGPAPLVEVIAECMQAANWASERGMNSLQRTALNLLALATAMQGRFDEGYRYLGTVANLPERSTTPAGQLAVGAVELLAGNLGAAERSLRQGYELAERQGVAGIRSLAAAELARALLLLAREEEAEPLVHLVEQSQCLVRVEAPELRALLIARRGDLAAAASLARDAVAVAGQSDQPEPLARAWLNLARILRQGGKISEARNAAQRSLDLYQHKGNLTAAQAVEQELESLRNDEG